LPLNDNFLMNSVQKKITAAGLLVTLGIIYGDIGTSPLYVLRAVIGTRPVSELLVLGGVSCIFWTLTLQTSIKYIFLTLQADNHGEGGIFSLYALIRRHGKWLVWPAIIGAGTLLADGIITPPISVSSAIEGLQILYPNIHTVPIVVVIITLLFFFQKFGTKLVGSSFGPIMFIWFIMLGVLGLNQVATNPFILRALNPIYAFDLLTKYPRGFWLLGSVFLCTTGAEALYSDLGHCGKENIRISWILVKVTLVINYFGQAAWILRQHGTLGDKNPFYAMMPTWFLFFGILIATAATIIASQALISGSFTLISEALSLNFWPRVSVKNPTNLKGQIYIPSINWILWAGCIAVQLYFKQSANMEAAYGFSITIAMLMTTILLSRFLLYIKKVPIWIVAVFLLIFCSIESAFFIANVAKITQRWMFLFFEFGIIFTMWIWYKARKINNRFLHFVNIEDYLGKLNQLTEDTDIPKYATHLVYLTKANNDFEIEQKVLNSIFAKKPKRADVYWFVHIDRTNEPYTMEYSVNQMDQYNVVKINLKLGFRIQPRVNVFFRNVVENMVKNGEIQLESKYDPHNQYNPNPDFKFIVLEKFLSYENEMGLKEGFILNSYFFLKKMAQTEEKTFGLDTSDVFVEKVPYVVKAAKPIQIRRVDIQRQPHRVQEH